MPPLGLGTATHQLRGLAHVKRAEKHTHAATRAAAGWYQANDALQKLVQAYHVTKHEVAKLAAALEEEERSEPQLRTFVNWGRPPE